MTDRELLELAAKAAGIEWVPTETQKGWECDLKFGLWLRIDGEPYEGQRRRFNPLNDDGDALRLAVKLGIDIGQAWFDHWNKESADQYAATRFAIVRAAAEIGKAMT
jgi:hypothetical protein